MRVNSRKNTQKRRVVLGQKNTRRSGRLSKHSRVKIVFAELVLMWCPWYDRFCFVKFIYTIIAYVLYNLYTSLYSTVNSSGVKTAETKKEE